MGAILVKTEREVLTNLEWLTQQMRAKTINFQQTTGVAKGGINFEERCGAIASIQSPPHQALLSILVWGDYRDSTQDYKCLQEYIAELLYEHLEKTTQRKHFDLKKFAMKVARMEIFFYFRHELKKQYTLDGRLKFAGIKEVTAPSYSNKYSKLGAIVEGAIQWMFEDMEFYIDEYRKNLKKD